VRVHLFAYGSILWRPGFAAPPPTPAVAHGWVRRLWQGSADHRGTPERMGRVATLVPDPHGSCAGALFLLEGPHVPALLSDLDVREQGGYQRATLTVHPLHGGPALEALCWVARQDNPCFLGPAPAAEIAHVVRTTVGPSGTNREYVLRLRDALVAQGTPDAHLEEVCSLL
jgi:cation transport protein ChaC